MKYLRVLILSLMAIALVFRVDGVWVLLTVSLLVTLNAPMMMIVTAAMVIGLLEAYAWLSDYVLFHLLVYFASLVAVLLSLAHRIVEKPDQARSGEEKMWLALIEGKSDAEKQRLIEAVKALLTKMKEDDGQVKKS